MIDNKKLLTMKLNDENYIAEDGVINSLCDKAKTLLIRHLVFDSYDNPSNIPYWFNAYDFEYLINLTPIEQIFYITYIIYVNDILDYSNDIINIPFSVALIDGLEPQKQIAYKDKNYKADFEIDFTHCSNIKDLKYVIELDGYNYHSTKHQMNYDYERENNLKEIGYKVIRFTGSQIYKQSYLCIEKLINIIINNLEKEKKHGN